MVVLGVIAGRCDRPPVPPAFLAPLAISDEGQRRKVFVFVFVDLTGGGHRARMAKEIAAHAAWLRGGLRSRSVALRLRALALWLASHGILRPWLASRKTRQSTGQLRSSAGGPGRAECAPRA